LNPSKNMHVTWWYFPKFKRIVTRLYLKILYILEDHLFTIVILLYHIGYCFILANKTIIAYRSLACHRVCLIVNNGLFFMILNSKTLLWSGQPLECLQVRHIYCSPNLSDEGHSSSTLRVYYEQVLWISPLLQQIWQY
jgi:hypothetical protein